MADCKVSEPPRPARAVRQNRGSVVLNVPVAAPVRGVRGRGARRARARGGRAARGAAGPAVQPAVAELQQRIADLEAELAGREEPLQVVAPQMANALLPVVPVPALPVFQVDPVVTVPGPATVPVPNDPYAALMAIVQVQQQQITALIQAATADNGPLLQGSSTNQNTVVRTQVQPLAGTSGMCAPSTSTVHGKPPALPHDFSYVSDKLLAELYDLSADVEREKLLPVNATSSVVPGEAKLTQKDDHYVLTSSYSKRVKICSISQWNEAFLIFKRVRSFYYPQLAAPLDTYHCELNSLAGTYTIAVWLEYDKRFRQLRTRDHNRPKEWKVVNQNLLNSCINRHPGRAAIPLCRICDDANHNEQQCHKKSGTKAAAADWPYTASTDRAGRPGTGSSRQFRQDICRNWNYGRCDGPKCLHSSRKHACEECDATDHAVFQHGGVAGNSHSRQRK